MVIITADNPFNINHTHNATSNAAFSKPAVYSLFKDVLGITINRSQEEERYPLPQEVNELYLHSLKEQSRNLVESFKALQDERSKTIKFNGRDSE